MIVINIIFKGSMDHLVPTNLLLVTQITLRGPKQTEVRSLPQ